MAINYPTSLDTLTNPSATDDTSDVDHAGQHSDANDAIEALQAKVGINSSAVTTSLDYRVATLEGAGSGSPALPRIKDGLYIWPNTRWSTNDTNTAIGLGTVCTMYPIYLRADTTYDTINVYCGAATGAGNIRAMIYAEASDGGAGALELDAGEVTVTTGTITWSISYVPPADGWYWLGVMNQNSGNTYWGGKFASALAVGSSSIISNSNAGHRYTNTYSSLSSDLSGVTPTFESNSLYLTMTGALT